jgi:hypothetical protein
MVAETDATAGPPSSPMGTPTSAGPDGPRNSASISPKMS